MSGVEVEVSPSDSLESGQNSVSSLSNGIVDYSLKCLSGNHKGKFIYINQSHTGEIIGGNPELEEVTLGIREENLDSKHCQVVYRKGSYYIHDLDSSTGTWHKMGAFVYLPIEDQMEIMLEGVSFKFTYGKQIEDPLYHLLKKHGLASGLSDLQNAGFTSVDKFVSLTNEDFGRIKNIFPEKQELVSEMMKSFKNDLIPGYIDKHLVVTNKYSQIEEIKDWETFTIGNTEASSISAAVCESPSNNDVPACNYLFDVMVCFQQGSYWLVNHNSYPIKNLFTRVGTGSIYSQVLLRAGAHLKINRLEMKVCRFNTGKAEQRGSVGYMAEKILVFQELGVSQKIDVSMFMLFDGHNQMKKCQQVVSDELPSTIKHKLQQDEENQPLDEPTSEDHHSVVYQYLHSLLESSFTEVDNRFLMNHFKLHMNNTSADFGMGCTALTILLVGDLLVCANLGVARAIVSRKKKPIMLTKDHTTKNPEEAQRIRDICEVMEEPLEEEDLQRLGPTRSFGCIEYKAVSGVTTRFKQSLVISKPEITSHKIDFTCDDFLVLGSDGLFLNMCESEIVEFVHDQLAAMPIGQQDVQQVTEKLVLKANERNKGRDSVNVSALVVAFTRAVSEV